MPFGEPGFFFLVGILPTVVVFLLILLVVVFLIRPARPDRRGRRPYAVYLFSVMFVSLLTLLGAVGAMAIEAGEQVSEGASWFGSVRPIVIEREGMPVQVAPLPEPIAPEAEVLTPGRIPPTAEVRPLELSQSPRFGEPGPAIRAGIIAAVAAVFLGLHVRLARRLITKEASGG